MLRTVSDLDDFKYYGKKVLMRVDFNVTLDNGIIGEDYRIRMTIPTIEYLTKHGAKLILASHLDRPIYPDINYSLAPVVKRLSQIMPQNRIMFATDCIGADVEKQVDNMDKGNILLLENLRFHKEEQENDLEFSKKLASLAEVYVNDAFSTSHRKHASIYGVAKFFDIKAAGLNLKREVDYLSMIKQNPVKPFILVIGGVKIKDKIGALENLLPKADKLLLGGATAYTFLKAQGFKIGNSIIDDEHLAWIEKALSAYRDKIMLPVDHIVSSSSRGDAPVNIVKGNIPDEMTGFDIGNETVQDYTNELAETRSGTVFWNGPMGLFEIGPFSNGTISIAKSIALAFWRGSKTLLGGGDTIAALKKADVSENEVTHVSTGGGATLRYLAGDEMPGIEALEGK
jgi:phosphoglycerate kinase